MIKPLNVPYRSDAIVKVVKETEGAKSYSYKLNLNLFNRQD